MNFHLDESVALFIDGANLNATARALGFEIEYAMLPDVFAAGGRLVRAYFYTALLEIGDHARLRPVRRLARIQRLHRGDQARQGVRRSVAESASPAVAHSERASR